MTTDIDTISNPIGNYRVWLHVSDEEDGQTITAHSINHAARKYAEHQFQTDSSLRHIICRVKTPANKTFVVTIRIEVTPMFSTSVDREIT